MNKRLSCLVVSCCLVFTSPIIYAEDDKPVTHVIMVWLKKPNNSKMRHDFIQASRQLNDLPGIINRHVGEVMPSDKTIVDDTFDVAVTVTLKNRQAFEAYMKHPKHKKLIETRLKPLVNRIVAYDFVSQ